MRNVSDKICKETKTHFLCPITFSKNHAVYEIPGKYCEDRRAADENIIWWMYKVVQI
jgi:hypothetical protein